MNGQSEDNNSHQSKSSLSRKNKTSPQVEPCICTEKETNVPKKDRSRRRSSLAPDIPTSPSEPKRVSLSQSEESGKRRAPPSCDTCQCSSPIVQGSGVCVPYVIPIRTPEEYCRLRRHYCPPVQLSTIPEVESETKPSGFTAAEEHKKSKGGLASKFPFRRKKKSRREIYSERRELQKSTASVPSAQLAAPGSFQEDSSSPYVRSRKESVQKAPSLPYGGSRENGFEEAPLPRYTGSRERRFQEAPSYGESRQEGFRESSSLPYGTSREKDSRVALSPYGESGEKGFQDIPNSHYTRSRERGFQEAPTSPYGGSRQGGFQETSSLPYDDSREKNARVAPSPYGESRKKGFKGAPTSHHGGSRQESLQETTFLLYGASRGRGSQEAPSSPYGESREEGFQETHSVSLGEPKDENFQEDHDLSHGGPRKKSVKRTAHIKPSHIKEESLESLKQSTRSPTGKRERKNLHQPYRSPSPEVKEGSMHQLYRADPASERKASVPSSYPEPEELQHQRSSIHRVELEDVNYQEAYVPPSSKSGLKSRNNIVIRGDTKEIERSRVQDDGGRGDFVPPRRSETGSSPRSEMQSQPGADGDKMDRSTQPTPSKTHEETENCWSRRTPYEKGLILMLIVAVLFLVLLLSIYILYGLIWPESVTCDQLCDGLYMMGMERKHELSGPRISNRSLELKRKMSQLPEIESCSQVEKETSFPYVAALLSKMYNDQEEDYIYICSAILTGKELALTSSKCIGEFDKGNQLYLRVNSDYWSKGGNLIAVLQVFALREYKYEDTLVALRFERFEKDICIKYLSPLRVDSPLDNYGYTYTWQYNISKPLKERFKFYAIEEVKMELAVIKGELIGRPVPYKCLPEISAPLISATRESVIGIHESVSCDDGGSYAYYAVDTNDVFNWLEKLELS